MDPVCSVPHTGTRTLVKRLGTTQFYHFGQNDSEIRNLKHFHFPVRDPLATSLSWRSYDPERESCDEFRRWSLAIAWLADHDHTVHRMEDYPVTEGQSGNHFWWKKAYHRWEIDKLLELPEVEYLFEWITIPSVQSFFLQYYPEGFWWQKMVEQPSLKRSEAKDTLAVGSPPTFRDGRLIA